jgi:hypothetical protein
MALADPRRTGVNHEGFDSDGDPNMSGARMSRQMPKAADADIRARFLRLINMTPREIEAWHATRQSKSVGQDAGDGESIGVKAGRRVAALLRSRRAPSADDLRHMRRVVSFIRRLSAQAPRRNRETSRWRYALMNWGHDPLRPGDAESPWRD